MQPDKETQWGDIDTLNSPQEELATNDNSEISEYEWGEI